MSKEYTPFKMKGNPIQRNFGIGSPLYDHEKDDSGNVIKHEKKKDWFAEDKRTDAEKKAEQKAFEKGKSKYELEYLNDPDAFEEKYPDGPPKSDKKFWAGRE
jgi:hypothetical protein